MTVIADQIIREEALNPRHSYIVQAPAGSGKTTLLIQRLLALLANVEKPEECLAITFTRKAAGEMRDRILAALQLAENQDPPANSHDYQTWNLAKAVLHRNTVKKWDLLENPSRLKIQTVDALCASLAAQMPMLSQFGAMPTVADDPQPLYQEAARNFLLSSMTASLDNLLFHLDNNLEFAQRLLSEMLSIREQWLPYINLSSLGTRVKTLLEQGLQAAIIKSLNNVTLQLSQDEVLQQELLELARYAATELKTQGVDSPITHCLDMLCLALPCLDVPCSDLPSMQLPGTTRVDFSEFAGWAALNAWQGIAELLLTEKNEFRKTVTLSQGFEAPSRIKDKQEKAKAQAMKSRMLSLLEKLQPHNALLEALQILRVCPPPYYSDNAWKAVEGIVNSLPHLAAHLTLVFQLKGQVDFAEVAIAASRALQENDDPSDLALHLDYKIQHILVDEFQDISIPQQRLLEQLTLGWQPTDGRTLFLVGDPQQSIYRFRQAEVGLFLQAKHQGLGSISLIPLTLTVNFRSTHTIIHWINKTFSELFPKRDDIGFGSVAFSPSVSIDASFLEKKSRETLPSKVMVHHVDEQSEAEFLMKSIQESRALDPLGNIAVLVRSRSHLKQLLPMLKKNAIPYQGLDIEPFMQHPLAQDLLSFTKALLHLGDRIAWFSLLRMPGVCLPLQDIVLLANDQPQLTLWVTLKNYSHSMVYPLLSEETKEILACLVPCLEATLNSRDRYPLSIWIRKAWFEFQREALFNEEETTIMNYYFNFLEQQGYSTDFYDTDLLEKRCGSFYVPLQNQDPTAVQIMTIHKAKGLEFDTVILAGVERNQKVDSEKLLLWEHDLSCSGKPYLIFAPIRERTEIQDPVYRYLKTLHKKRSEFEDLRLLYVAATRARKRLYWLTHGGRFRQ